MTPEVKQALQDSINHWKDIAKGKDYTSRKNCALCNLFLNKTNSCDGCPIMQKTDEVSCYDTPYQEFINHVDVFHVPYISVTDKHRTYCAKCKDIAESGKAKILDGVKSNLPISYNTHGDAIEVTYDQDED